jgi:hypothetical protein
MSVGYATRGKCIEITTVYMKLEPAVIRQGPLVGDAMTKGTLCR